MTRKEAEEMARGIINRGVPGKVLFLLTMKKVEVLEMRKENEEKIIRQIYFLVGFGIGYLTMLFAVLYAFYLCGGTK